MRADPLFFRIFYNTYNEEEILKEKERRLETMKQIVIPFKEGMHTIEIDDVSYYIVIFDVISDYYAAIIKRFNLSTMEDIVETVKIDYDSLCNEYRITCEKTEVSMTIDLDDGTLRISIW